MDTIDYVSKFYPFEMPDIVKNGVEMRLDISGDNTMMALAMTFADRETAVNMSFQRNYAEPFEWVKAQFVDWALLFSTATFYYEKECKAEEKELYQQMMTVFSVNSACLRERNRDFFVGNLNKDVFDKALPIANRAEHCSNSNSDRINLQFY